MSLPPAFDDVFAQCLGRLQASAAYAWECPPLRPSLALATPDRCAWLSFNRWPAPPYAFEGVPADRQAAVATRTIQGALGRAAHQGRAAAALGIACLALIEAHCGVESLIQRAHTIRERSDTPLAVLLIADGGAVFVTVCAARAIGTWAPLDVLTNPPYLAA